MARFGQIPPYGDNWTRESVPGYDPDYSPTRYVFKADPMWSMRSSHDSHKWWLFYGTVPVSEHFRTMSEAMNAMLWTWNFMHPSLPLAPARTRNRRRRHLRAVA